MDVYEDQGRSLSIEDIISKEHATQFTPFHKDVPVWGFSDSAYWYRTVVHNPLPTDQALIIEQTSTWIDHMTIYVADPAEESGFSGFCLGDKHPFSERKIAHTDFLYPITLPAGESVPIYIRIQSRAAVFTPITFWKKDAYHQHDRYLAYFVGGFFGILGIMFIYNLFLYINTRDSNYLYYIFCIAAFGMMFANSKGFSLMYLWPESPLFVERVQTAVISLFQMCGILFSIKFLETRHHTPLLHRLLTIVATGHLLVIASSFIVDDIVPVSKITLIAVQINGPLLLIAGIRAWSRGSRTVRFYLLAWMSGILGYILTTLTLLGHINYNFFIYNGAFIGGLLDMAFLSFALADRIKLLNKEKDEARESAEATLNRLLK